MNINKWYNINDEKILGQGCESVVKECSSTKYYNDELCVKITKADEQFVIQNEETFKKIIEFTNLHIVKIFDYFQHQGNFYLIMKQCNGGNLQQKIEKLMVENKLLEAKDVLSFVYQFSQGYFDINQNKIILKNLKPSKILLHHGLYKIGGFGSNIQNNENANLYNSPQQLQQLEYTAKTDMYSLGVIIYHLCFLNIPYNAENLQQFQQQLQNNKFTINQVQNNGSDQERQEIKYLIEKMIVYNENERISFQELFDRVSDLPVYQKYKTLQNLLSGLNNYIVLSDVLQ